MAHLVLTIKLLNTLLNTAQNINKPLKNNNQTTNSNDKKYNALNYIFLCARFYQHFRG